ncbi:hypothetical protein IX53_00175 [Kosmotoga pacifica]|uniref:Helix-hairpin-helix DNA-binding motif class 1 domain-containing protein n=1 Tax=Kosmotoga pacifica TaxID=1330330 RepID=A0A0G2ZH90_9BACT|nr:hypothetical protein IX53_00175 [Kosmotoga pacifica]
MKRLSAKEAQILGAFLFVLIMALVAVLSPENSVESTAGEKLPGMEAKERFPIDINIADIQTLELLPDIGSTKAKSIVAYRETHGGFTSLEDLLNVKGIGPATLEKIKEFISVNQPKQEQTQDTINKLDLNKASLEELIALPGIGDSKAKSIIEYRENRGGFDSIEQLKEVKGIGEKIFAGLKDFITVKTRSGKMRTPATSGPEKLNVNLADIEELQKLPGIGPVLAERIVSYREERGPFKDPLELRNVKGIGDKTLEKIREMIDF